MALHAYKDGDDPDGREVRQACEALRVAVKRHNKAFRK